jgi:hypothetical protein
MSIEVPPHKELSAGDYWAPGDSPVGSSSICGLLLPHCGLHAVAIGFAFTGSLTAVEN